MAEKDKEGKENKELKTALAAIEKEFGKGAIMSLGGMTALDIEGISTGSLSLDIALGGKGLPRGRVVEIYGAEASGKTTIALHAVAQAQKNGGVAAFIDAEHALDPSWAKRLGVDLDALLVSPTRLRRGRVADRRDAHQVERRGHHRHRLGRGPRAEERDSGQRDRRHEGRACRLG